MFSLGGENADVILIYFAIFTVCSCAEIYFYKMKKGNFIANRNLTLDLTDDSVRYLGSLHLILCFSHVFFCRLTAAERQL